MINAKELRIGNFVDYEKTTHIISELHNDKVLHKWKTAKDWYCTLYEDIDGIEINKEWLLKFGAIQPYEDEPAFFQIGVIQFKLTKEGLIICDEVFRDDPILGTKPLKQIHQLQNLFFALTGEELTLNNE